MNPEDVLPQLKQFGINISPDDADAMLQPHAQAVQAAEERFKAWGNWELISQRDEDRAFDVYRNKEYIVAVAEVDTRDDYFGVVIYLVCSRRDGEPIHSWLDLQQIKNSLTGKHQLAIVVYPADYHLWDTVNCYHLWVLPEHNQSFPLDLTVLSQNRSYKSERQLQRELLRGGRR